MRSHFLRSYKRPLIFVGRATAVSTADSGTFSLALNSLTGGIGSSPQSDDLIFVVNGVSTDFGTGYSFTTPSGYTKIVDNRGNDTNDAAQAVYYKKSAGNETSVTINATNTTDMAAIGIAHVWRNINVGTPIDVTSTTAVGGDTGRPNVPSITPVTPGCVILGFGVGTLGTGSSALTASGLSNVVAATQPNVVSGVAGIIAAYTAWTTGAYDMPQFGGGSTSTAQSWASAAVVIRPK